MPKYNFYEIMRKKVPDDLNEPVRNMLAQGFNCPEAVAELNGLEAHINCGEVSVYEKATRKNVTIKTNYGMVEGYDLVKNIETDKFVIIVKKHIKNPNLDMKKWRENERDTNRSAGPTGRNQPATADNSNLAGAA